MGQSAYQPFQPEPEDELVLPGAAAGEGAEGAPHVDNTPPGFDDRPVAPPPLAEPPPPVVPPPPARVFKEPAATPRPAPTPVVAAAAPPPPPPVVPPPPVDQFDEPEQSYDPAEPYDYRYPPASDDWDRRGGPGMSALAIGGFVLLGILALGVGAVMSGLFSGGVAVGSPSPTPQISLAPSATPGQSAAASTGPSLPAVTPIPTGASPVPLPDGFSARVEPCATEPKSQKGCSSSGATVSNGSVWVWIGFRKGNDADVLAVTVMNSAGASVGDGSLALGSIGCGDSCSGWARFRFSGLAVGDYTIKVERNDAPVAEATFTVTG